MENKNCISCSKPIKGRTDKKFCNDYCRNAYNNKNRAIDNESIRYVNRILNKNRNILQEHLGENRAIVKVKKETLLEEGFVFRYFTHLQKNKRGTQYFLCYDYGYLPIGQDWCVVFLSEQAFGC
jgi:predicted nucleic acid-binding Zn ribbon protein